MSSGVGGLVKPFGEQRGPFCVHRYPRTSVRLFDPGSLDRERRDELAGAQGNPSDP